MTRTPSRCDASSPLPEPSLNGRFAKELETAPALPSGKRIPGLKLDHPRQLALMHALVRFAHIAAGNTFTTAELYP